MIIDKKDLKEKFLQSFIIGYKGTEPSEDFWNTIDIGLGGIIFFAENLKNRDEFKNLVSQFNNSAKNPLFLSIDQEGGLVERTVFFDKKVEYLTPKALSNLKDEKIFKKHYEILAEDLLDLGINMNFAPVLDVNSNPANPIIGVRSFGDNPDIINYYSKLVTDVFKKYNIISCGKHYAGHGDTSVDSHLNMPCINIEFDDFYKNHLVCFEKAIKNNIDTIMISHVHFSFFDKEKIPCSISKNAIDYLKNQLNFKGLILSDDMVMGGISKHYGLKESILLALRAGIEVMLFQYISDELLLAIDEITEIALKDEQLQNIIRNNYKKITDFKQKKLTKSSNIDFDIEVAQNVINTIAKDTIVIDKKGILTLDKDKNIKIVSFNHKDIFNLSTREKNLSDFLKNYSVEEIYYPVNPDMPTIEKIVDTIKNDDIVIFISYNMQVNEGQKILFNKIKSQKILVNCGLNVNDKLLEQAESTISLYCAKTPSLKALAEVLIKK